MHTKSMPLSICSMYLCQIAGVDDTPNGNQMYLNNPLDQLLNHHNSLFKPGLGMLKDYKAKIYVDPQTKPKFCKARPVSYSM